ncbi:hypothetical protein LSAT2_018248 [Lamellibrachia satsuma]|nr:hypothetical protein LSAT2_018248 [Lamellibrachia satsuma]
MAGPQDGLRTLWEQFLRVPLDSESRQKKCAKLERFLLAMLDMSSKGHDIPKFSVTVGITPGVSTQTLKRHSGNED